ncbi:MAG: PilZ domain-containing protein [Myxococcota bacterium]|nr:PilZ domain-containing protein [Myxococcota bacterium]
MSDARRALVVDGADTRLGEVALRLLRLGIDLHYSAEPAEAWLLAEEVADGVRLLILNPRLPAEEIVALEERLRAHAPHIPRTLMVIGRQPDEATRSALRGAGVDLALWEPYDETELRAAISAAMAPQSGHPDARKHPRIATMLLARASMGLLRTDAIVSSLSLGGAFLEGPEPFPQGARFTLEIALPEETVSVHATVVYTSEAEPQAARATGMGVAFTRVDGAADEGLRRFLVDHEKRFAV